MIISKTPFRISFFGGGTDYPVWYEEHGGCVLATTINRYCYLTCRRLPPFFEYRNRIVYSQVETTANVDEIRHPAVRECLRHMGITDGMEIHHDGDLPARTGLGSSSSFTVGMLNALHALQGGRVAPMELAREAIHVERDLCRENVGVQDQVLAAHGGLNHIKFLPGDIITVHPVTLSSQRMKDFQSHLMLFFTGLSRFASEIAGEQIQNTPKKTKEIETMKQMVDEGLRILSGPNDLNDFGRLLHESWKLKRTLTSRISNETIDTIYETARKNGAAGGKLCGAGGGGFMLLFADPERHPAIREALRDYLHVPFQFEWLGSQIAFYQPA